MSLLQKICLSGQPSTQSPPIEPVPNRHLSRWISTGLVVGFGITLLTACRVTFIDYDGDDDDPIGPLFSTELVILDDFNQPTNTFNLGENVTVEVTITNLTDETQILEFDTDQQHDFYITDENFNPVWDWSDDQSFDNANTTLTFQANQLHTFTATWDQFDNDDQIITIGNYQVQALIPVLGEGLNRHLSLQQSEFRSNILIVTIQ